MALGDVYEVKHVMRDWDMKHLENVYFYEHVADPVGGGYATQAERLANDWKTDVLTPMQPTQTAFITTSEIRVRNLFNPADNYVLPLALAGTRGGFSEFVQPSFLAVVATLATDNGLVQKGRKMLSGLLEGDAGLGLLTIPATVLFAVRAALMLLGVSNLFGGAKAFEPVVVKRIRTGTPGNYTYRLPTSQIEKVVGNVTSVVISTIVSAQDTRKK